jgi:hypothetical protein
MFWASLFARAVVRLSWKIWVAILLYLFVSFLPLAVAAGRFSVAESGPEQRMRAVVYLVLFGAPYYKGFISFFVISRCH